MSYIPAYMFNYAKELKSVDNCLLGKDMEKFKQSPVGMFRACNSLERVGTLTFDFNNLIYEIGSSKSNYSALFQYCKNLISVGDITFINVNESISNLYNNKNTMLDLSYVFHDCTKIINLPKFNIGKFIVRSMYHFARNCTNLSYCKVLPITNDCSLGWAFYYCKNIKTIDWTNSNINTSYTSSTDRAFSHCENLSSMPGFKLPRETSLNEIFNNCKLLPIYYHSDSKYRYYSYANRESMVGAPENFDWVFNINTASGIECHSAHRKVKGFKNVSLSITYDESVLNMTPNRLTNKIECDRLQFPNAFEESNTVENVSISIQPYLGDIYFRYGINFDYMFNKNAVKTLTFNEELGNNLAGTGNIISMYYIIGGSENTIEYIHNFPVNVATGPLCNSIGTQIKEITWSGSLDKDFNISTICSGEVISLPPKCIEDLLINHTEIVSNKKITLGGKLLGLISSEAIQVAIDKGWEVV